MIVYLEYSLYIIILILVYILYLSIKERVIEGFEHIGDAFVADTHKKSSKLYSDKEVNNVIQTTTTMYTIASFVSMVLIKTPYKIWRSSVDKGWDITQSFFDFLKPMLDFFASMFDSFISFIKLMFKLWLKIFKSGFHILINLPEAVLKFTINIQSKMMGAMSSL